MRTVLGTVGTFLVITLSAKVERLDYVIEKNGAAALKRFSSLWA